MIGYRFALLPILGSVALFCAIEAAAIRAVEFTASLVGCGLLGFILAIQVIALGCGFVSQGGDCLIRIPRWQLIVGVGVISLAMAAAIQWLIVGPLGHMRGIFQCSVYFGCLAMATGLTLAIGSAFIGLARLFQRA